MSLAVGLSPFVPWIIGGRAGYGTVISRVHVRKDVYICCCPWFLKCLPFCDVSAGFNVTEGEKKLNNSNLIIKYPSCSNFNLGRESKIAPVTGDCSRHSLVDCCSPVVKR